MLNEHFFVLRLMQVVQRRQHYVSEHMKPDDRARAFSLPSERIAPVSTIASAIRYCVYEFRLKPAMSTSHPHMRLIDAQNLRRRQRTNRHNMFPQKPITKTTRVPAKRQSSESDVSRSCRTLTHRGYSATRPNSCNLTGCGAHSTGQCPRGSRPRS